MWYRDLDRGRRLYAAMRADVLAIKAGEEPSSPTGWAPEDVHEMLAAWGFHDEYLPGPARLTYHSKHTDLDLVVPWADPVQYLGVLKPAVELVETLLRREGHPVEPMKE